MIALQIIPQVIFLPVPTAATSLTQMGEFGAQSWVHFWCIVISFLARFTRASVLKPLWCSQSQLTIYLYVRRQELCVIFLVSSFRSSFILTFQNKMKKRSCLRYLSAAHVYMYIYVCAYHTIIQYSELEETHKDHRGQLHAPHSTIQKSDPMSEIAVQTLLEFQHWGPCPPPCGAAPLPNPQLPLAWCVLLLFPPSLPLCYIWAYEIRGVGCNWNSTWNAIFAMLQQNCNLQQRVTAFSRCCLLTSHCSG